MIRRLAFALFILYACAQEAAAQPVSVYGVLQCTQSAFYDGTATGLSQIVAPASSGGVGERIYVCAYTMQAGGAVNLSLSYGTGTNCATGTTALTPVWVFAAAGAPVVDFGGPIVVPPGNALCVNASAAVAAKVLVRYLQQPGM